MTKHPHDADVAFIQALAEVLAKNDLTELQVKREYGEEGSLNVRVSRAKTVVAEYAPQYAPQYAPHAAPAAQAAAPSAGAATEGSGDPASLPGAITSPMVGTAYLSAEPGASPFVSVGDRVTEGQTLLIVEAMKTMNHIPSPKAGVVRRVLVEDGAPVEYGAPLMVVE
jgi:acetyl-CoA carboxylase biotin carboxyl carrier protein